jgi:hypothetical protein
MLSYVVLKTLKFWFSEDSRIHAFISATLLYYMVKKCLPTCGQLLQIQKADAKKLINNLLIVENFPTFGVVWPK